MTDLITPNSAAMTLQYVEARRGQRGHPLQVDRTTRMEAIVEVIGRQTMAITARHLFYLLTGKPYLYPKTQPFYGRVLADLLELRRSGDVAWDAITDGTRTKTRWIGYGSLAEAAREWQDTYRRDVWRDTDMTCEVWTESRGLLGTINEIASQYGVTTLGVGGFNSVSVGYQTAQDVLRAGRLGKRFVIFHFGDHDPSGMAIGDSAEREIRWHLDRVPRGTNGYPWADMLNEGFRFLRVALTAAQVEAYDLPTAPVKVNKAGGISGGHARSWEGGVTELDALDPHVLQGLVRNSIESVLDPKALEVARAAEESERLILGNIDRLLGVDR